MGWLTRSPSAAEVLAGLDLSGQRILITGCNAGIGFETAKALAGAGASVLLACRSLAKAEDTARRIGTEIPKAATEPVVLDLGELATVAALCERLRGTALDTVICNAGVFPASYAESADGIERCFAICHLGHHALATRLRDALFASRGRVVVVASELHRSPARLDFDNLPPRRDGYAPLRAYGQAKLCNVLFAKALSRRWREHGVRVNALHPGTMIATSIGRDSTLARIAMTAVRPFTKTVAQGAATTVHVAAAPAAAGADGLYFRDRVPVAVSREAEDGAVAERLWELTEAMLAEHGFPAIDAR